MQDGHRAGGYHHGVVHVVGELLGGLIGAQTAYVEFALEIQFLAPNLVDHGGGYHGSEMPVGSLVVAYHAGGALGQGFEVCKVAEGAVLGSRFSVIGSGFSVLGSGFLGDFLLHLLDAAAGGFGLLFIGFGFLNLANGALDGSIRLAQDIRCLFLGFCQYLFLLGLQSGYLCLVVFDFLLQMFLPLADSLALVLPIAFVAGNILQRAVVVYMVAAHQFLGVRQYLVAEAGLLGYLECKARPGLPDGELEQRS